MAVWREPTEEEAQIVLKNQRRRYFNQRLSVGLCLLVILIGAMVLMGFSNKSKMDQRTAEILGYNPIFSPQLIGVGYQADTEEVTKSREEREKKIADAKAQAEKEVNDENLPYLVGVPVLAAVGFAVYFALTLIPFYYYKNRKYEVAMGEFEDKRFIRVTRYSMFYYLVTRFEDGTTEEARTTRNVFDAAMARTPILMVRVPSILPDTIVLRACLLSEPESYLDL